MKSSLGVITTIPFVCSFLDNLKPAALNETEVEETLKQEFVAQQLLKMCGSLDLSDEVGRCVCSRCVWKCSGRAVEFKSTEFNFKRPHRDQGLYSVGSYSAERYPQSVFDGDQSSTHREKRFRISYDLFLFYFDAGSNLMG